MNSQIRETKGGHLARKNGQSVSFYGVEIAIVFWNSGRILLIHRLLSDISAHQQIDLDYSAKKLDWKYSKIIEEILTVLVQQKYHHKRGFNYCRTVQFLRTKANGRTVFRDALFWLSCNINGIHHWSGFTKFLDC